MHYKKTLFGLGLLLGITSAHGGSRASASYSIPADSVDGGGARNASAAYVNNGSIGGIGGTSTVLAPAETLKHGYIGQLLDSMSLFLSASPTNINENGTRQITAQIALDDGTLQPLSAGAVTWSVVSGPLSGVSPSGLASATNVYQDTLATVHGVWGDSSANLGLLVLNTGNDDFASYAGDGINDAWQVQYFGLNNVNAGPGFDPDADGQNNLFEYTAMTIPTDANSRFRMWIELVTGQPTYRNIRFNPYMAQRSYAVVRRPNVDSGSFVNVPGIMTPAGGGATFTDTNATANTEFYRVSITIP